MDSMNDALIALVKALGGSKAVGLMLWPEKMADAAQRTLLDCLNPERPAHLTPDQLALLLRRGHAVGYHAALDWLLHDLGYAAPVPLEPVDELADLERRFIASVNAQAETAARIERLLAGMHERRGALRSAA